MTKVKVFVYGQQQRWQQRLGYDNSSPDFRHGELKKDANGALWDFLVDYVFIFFFSRISLFAIKALVWRVHETDLFPPRRGWC